MVCEGRSDEIACYISSEEGVVVIMAQGGESLDDAAFGAEECAQLRFGFGNAGVGAA